MEHIGKTLGQSLNPETIPNLITYDRPEDDPDYKPTEETLKEQLRRSLNLSSWDNTFEAFNPWTGTEKAVAAFKELALGKASWFMLLNYGTAGCGKTHLCEALSIELAKRGIRVRVNEWGELVRRWKVAMRSEIQGLYDSQFDNFRKLSHIIIDDVGMGGRGSEYEWGELEDIIRYRYRENLWTVITTNLDIKPNPKNPNQAYIPQRIVSRFRDTVKSRLILNAGEDYRPIKS